eukprot:IDg13602t1
MLIILVSSKQKLDACFQTGRLASFSFSTFISVSKSDTIVALMGVELVKNLQKSTAHTQ